MTFRRVFPVVMLAAAVLGAVALWRSRTTAPPASPYPTAGAKVSPMPADPVGPFDPELADPKDIDLRVHVVSGSTSPEPDRAPAGSGSPRNAS
ncbi:MAG: hypothetical protein U0Q22_08880 [Acidimicrobiales bacterium]